MVTTEALTGESNSEQVKQALLHHWGLDSMAASELSQGVTQEGREHILGLTSVVEEDPEGIIARDTYREEIAKIYRGESDKQMIVVGPCSLESETDYEELFDYIAELQEANPAALIVLRGNGSKPRTSGGWGGVFRDIDPKTQDSLIEIYKEAFKRKIPIITEVTEKDEFLTLAPYLSGAWLGARDMLSTSLHATLSATNIPVAVKNPQDGSVKAIQNVITALGKNTHGIKDDEDQKGNEGSGVNLGILAYTYRTGRYGLPSMVEVGEGNQNVGIIARGYELSEDMPAEEKAKKAFEYIGRLCTLGAKLNRKVLIDGQHDVPPMFDIDKKVADRFLKVMPKIVNAALNGQIEHAEMLGGVIVEMSPHEGRTDVNLPVVVAKDNQALDSLIKSLTRLGRLGRQIDLANV